MRSKLLILLKNQSLATGIINRLRYEKDSKKRGKLVGAMIGTIVLYAMLFAYSFFTAIGYGSMGLAASIPIISVFSVALVNLLFTFLKTNAYLYSFREYDMLMSLPFKVKTVVSSKFLHMYKRNLPLSLGIMLPMMLVYGYYTKASALTYVLWVVLSPIAQLIPMMLASVLGTVIVAVGSKFRFKKLIQIILTFGFIFLAFASRFIIEALFRDNKVDDVLSELSNTLNGVKSIYLPAAWFEKAILENSILYGVLFIACSFVIYEIVFFLLSLGYCKVNTRLMSGAAHKKYKLQSLKTRSIVSAVAFKELKRMLGSTVYVTNAGFGLLLTLVAGVAALFLDMDAIIAEITNAAPVTKEMVIPALPLIVCLMNCMCATTAMTPSLEGKNYWIVQSLPLRPRELYGGKLLFNLLLTGPLTVVVTVLLCISCRAELFTTLLCALLGGLICLYTSVFGLVCGIRFMKLDWENEVEVVKQGAALALYMFPHMFGSMLLMVGAVVVGVLFNPLMVLGMLIGLYLILTLLFALIVKKQIEKM